MSAILRRALFITFIIAIQAARLDAQWPVDPTKSMRILIGAISPVIVSDGFGGAIVVGRVYVTSPYLVAQRVDSDGYVLWDKQLYGVPIAQKDEYDKTDNGHLLPDGDGGVFVAYTFCTNLSIWPDLDYELDAYVQHLDAQGVTKWGERGVSLCVLSGTQQVEGIVDDGNGGAIVVWRDWRSGEVETYAQRVSRDGEELWEENGRLISGKYLSLVASDGEGGAILIAYSGIGGQRITKDGELLWNEDEVDAAIGSFREMICDGSGNVLLSGRKKDDQGLGLFVQKINCNGKSVWAEGGVRISPVIDTQTSWARIAVDSSGDAVFTWRDRRTGKFDVYAQELDSSGKVLWADGGMRISCYETLKSDSDVINTISGESIFVWSDWRNDANSDLFCQKMDAFGERQWKEDVAIYVGVDSPSDHQIISDSAGGAIMAWYTMAPVRGVYVMRIDANGELGGAKGDVNRDGTVDVSDVVRAVRIILDVAPSATEYEPWSSDFNGDGNINALDIVGMVNEICNR